MNLIINTQSISQDQDGLFSLNDLHRASGGENKHRPTFFLANQETKDLIAVIESENKIAYHTVLGKGKNQGTYVCRELVYRYAMWISAKFSLMVIRAFDQFTQSQFIPAIAEQRTTISVEQQQAIRLAVAKRCKQDRVHYATVYDAIKKAFDIPRYDELLAVDFAECMALIENIQLQQAIDHQPFNIHDYLNQQSNQVMDYVHGLEQAVFTFTGKYPQRPFSKDEIAKGVIGACLNHQTIELNFSESGLGFNLVDRATLRIHDSNIAEHIKLGNVNKKYLDDIIQASVSRLA